MSNKVKVKEVMTHLVVTLKPEDSLEEAAARLARNHVSGLPVIEHGKVVGVISESDIIRALVPWDEGRHRDLSVLSWLRGTGDSAGRGKGSSVGEVMNPIVLQIPREASVWEAARIMTERRVNRLPVVDEHDYLVGIVSRADIVRAIADQGDPRVGHQAPAFAHEGYVADGA